MTKIPLRDMPDAALAAEEARYRAEYNRLLDRKDSSAVLIERTFGPNAEARFPELHRHLDVLHELWIRSMRR